MYRGCVYIGCAGLWRGTHDPSLATLIPEGPFAFSSDLDAPSYFPRLSTWIRSRRPGCQRLRLPRSPGLWPLHLALLFTRRRSDRQATSDRPRRRRRCVRSQSALPHAAIRHLKASRWERDFHQVRTARVTAVLKAAGPANVMSHEKHIVPVMVGHPEKCKEASDPTRLWMPFGGVIEECPLCVKLLTAANRGIAIGTDRNLRPN